MMPASARLAVSDTWTVGPTPNRGIGIRSIPESDNMSDGVRTSWLVQPPLHPGANPSGMILHAGLVGQRSPRALAVVKRSALPTASRAARPQASSTRSSRSQPRTQPCIPCRRRPEQARSRPSRARARSRKRRRPPVPATRRERCAPCRSPDAELAAVPLIVANAGQRNNIGPRRIGIRCRPHERDLSLRPGR